MYSSKWRLYLVSALGVEFDGYESFVVDEIVSNLRLSGETSTDYSNEHIKYCRIGRNHRKMIHEDERDQSWRRVPNEDFVAPRSGAP